MNSLSRHPVYGGLLQASLLAHRAALGVSRGIMGQTLTRCAHSSTNHPIFGTVSRDMAAQVSK